MGTPEELIKLKIDGYREMDIGELGESIFRQWAAQTNLVVNKVENDKDGWDFIVSFPFKIRPDLKSLDLDDAPLRCLVQVKATTTKKKTKNIKLSNLKKFVESPLPCFYLVIQIEDGKPKAAYLYHVWETIIEKLLRKFRKIDKEEWKSIHKKRMRLPPKEANEFEALNGEELLSLLDKSVGKSGKEYKKKKSDLVDSIGYGKVRGKANFEIFVPESYAGDIQEFLVDFGLGLVDKAKVKKFTYYDNRFEIPVEVESNEEGGSIKINDLNPDGDAVIKFKTSDGREVTEIRTQYFVPKAIGKVIDRKNIKLLFKAPYLQIIISFRQKNFKFDLGLPEISDKYPLADLKEMGAFISFFSEVEENEKIEIRIKPKNKQELALNLYYPVILDDDLNKLGLVIQKTNQIVNYLNLKQDLEIQPGRLLGQYDIINFLARLLSPVSTFVMTEFRVGNEIEGYEKTISLTPIQLIISDYIIIFLLGIHGKAIRQKNKKEGYFYQIESTNVQIEQYRQLSIDTDDIIEVVKDLYSIAKEKYDNDETMIIYDNIEDEL